MEHQMKWMEMELGQEEIKYLIATGEDVYGRTDLGTFDPVAYDDFMDNEANAATCYELRNIQWEHDGRDDDTSRYPTEFEFVDHRINGVGASNAIGHILARIEHHWGNCVRSFTLVDEHGLETVFSK